MLFRSALSIGTFGNEAAMLALAPEINNPKDATTEIITLFDLILTPLSLFNLELRVPGYFYLFAYFRQLLYSIIYQHECQ